MRFWEFVPGRRGLVSLGAENWDHADMRSEIERLLETL